MYQAPNYTQIPNSLLDEHIPLMGEAELRVTLAVARATLGWHKSTDKLSLSQLRDRTGMSRQGVISGIEDGLKRGTIFRTPDGQSYQYGLRVEPAKCPDSPPAPPCQLVHEVDQSASQPDGLVHEVDQLDMPTSPRSRPELVHEVDTQKKDLNKRSSSSLVPPESTTQDEQDLAIADEDDDNNVAFVDVNDLSLPTIVEPRPVVPTPADDTNITTLLSNTLQNVGVSLSAYIVDKYMDLVEQFGIRAVVTGIENAADNHKQHRFAYVEKCILTAVEGGLGRMQAATTPPSQLDFSLEEVLL